MAGENILLIKYMRDAGVPAETLEAYETLLRMPGSPLDAKLELMAEQREWLEERIAALQQTMEYLECKMEQLCQKEKPA